MIVFLLWGSYFSFKVITLFPKTNWNNKTQHTLKYDFKTKNVELQTDKWFGDKAAPWHLAFMIYYYWFAISILEGITMNSIYGYLVLK